MILSRMYRPKRKLYVDGGPIDPTKPDVMGKVGAGFGIAGGLLDALGAPTDGGRTRTGVLAASGAMKGAAAGMSLGPLGAAVGGTVGLIGGLIAGKKQKREEAAAAIEFQTAEKMRKQSADAAKLAANPELVTGSLSASYFATGGPMDPPWKKAIPRNVSESTSTGVKLNTKDPAILPNYNVKAPSRVERQKIVAMNKGVGDKNFAIVDKTRDSVYYYNKSGKLITGEPVITGASKNDVDRGMSMKKWMEQTGSSNHEDYFKYLKENNAQTTPAGAFQVNAVRTNTAKDPSLLGRMYNETFRPERAKEIRDSRIRDYGSEQKMLTLTDSKGKGSSKAIHGTNNPARILAFSKGDASRKLSNGCTNLPKGSQGFNILKPGSQVFYLPEEDTNKIITDYDFKKAMGGSIGPGDKGSPYPRTGPADAWWDEKSKPQFGVYSGIETNKGYIRNPTRYESFRNHIDYMKTNMWNNSNTYRPQWEHHSVNMNTLPPTTVAANGGKLANGYRVSGPGSLVKNSSDGLEVKGPSHAEGGVQLPGNNAEVEGQETIKDDFVYSAQLGFAQRHKPLMRAKGKIEKKPATVERINALRLIEQKEQNLAMEQEEFKKKFNIQ